jgi:hypothetical protein
MRSRFLLALPIVTVALLTVSCRHPARPSHIKEVNNLRLVAGDPALKAQGFDFTSKPPSPPIGDPSEAGASFTNIQWSPVSQFSLGPGQSKTVTVNAVAAGGVYARVSWTEGAGPVSVLMTQNGVVVGSGTSYSLPPDRGITVAEGKNSAAGAVSVMVRNLGPGGVQVQAVVGTLAGGGQ